MWKKLATAALCAIAFGGAAQAEVSVVNMSKQFGLPYLPMIVIEAQQLIEKNAKAAGLGAPTRGDTPPHRPALSRQGSPGVAESGC